MKHSTRREWANRRGWMKRSKVNLNETQSYLGILEIITSRRLHEYEQEECCKWKMFWSYCRYPVCWCWRCYGLQVMLSMDSIIYSIIYQETYNLFQREAEKILQKFPWGCQKGRQCLEREWSRVHSPAWRYHWWESKAAQGVRNWMWKGVCCLLIL